MYKLSCSVFSSDPNKAVVKHVIDNWGLKAVYILRKVIEKNVHFMFMFSD